MGEPSKTKQVGREYTTQGVEAATEAMKRGWSGLTAAIAGLPGIPGTLLETIDGKTNPNSYWASFMSQAPQLQNLIQGAQSPLEQGLTEQARKLSQEATSAVASNLSGLGSLYSGATLQNAAKATADAFSNVANLLGSQRVNLYGGLLGQALPTSLQAAQGDVQLQLQKVLPLLNMYGNLYGTGLQGLIGYGTPTFVQQKNPWYDILSGIAGGAAGAGAAKALAAI